MTATRQLIQPALSDTAAAAVAAPIESPNGGPVAARRRLQKRFQNRLQINPTLTRRLVSYQANRSLPGFRWLKYKEAFSRELVELLLDTANPQSLINAANPQSLLDPFSGIGTAPLTAAARGLPAAGIEIMPIGVLMSQTIANAANGLNPNAFKHAATQMLARINSSKSAPSEYAFPHVPITQAAFPPDAETHLAKAREYLATLDDDNLRPLLNFACMTVLESVSFTRKDGQYLRWDYRSGRQLRARVHKGPILKFPDALRTRFSEIIDDLQPLKKLYAHATPEFTAGSSLEHLRRIPANSYDLVITSPPYANRYDYTRTYALELAWLGYDRPAFTALRQNMLSATVENKSKRQWLQEIYDTSPLLDAAIKMYDEQDAIQEIAAILKERQQELGNPQVIRLLEGYFLEMAVIIAELGRIIRPGGIIFMINDNVQYHGEEVPVDLILSDFAEQSGFQCQRIWVLPRGKGNSSQQMGRFGRRELRKCVYQWVRNG